MREHVMQTFSRRATGMQVDMGRTLESKALVLMILFFKFSCNGWSSHFSLDSYKLYPFLWINSL
uniref:Uncharacterized protein n=1 Tax=Romanomermis culicivorax TaxID=13658 RepID=A0A915JIB8_ROMCU